VEAAPLLSGTLLNGDINERGVESKIFLSTKKL